jgi:hypothetical protein
LFSVFIDIPDEELVLEVVNAQHEVEVRVKQGVF